MTPTVGADIAKGLVTAEVNLPASPDIVFEALTTPERLQAWWGSEDTYRSLGWQIDLRPCGAWSVETQHRDGKRRSVRGQFMVVDRPRLLVQSWQPSWDGYRSTVIRWELEPAALGTRLRVSHGSFAGNPDSCREHARGWQQLLEWLEGYLALSGAAHVHSSV